MKTTLLFSLMISCVLIFAAAGSAMDLGLRGIGGEVGFVMPDYAGDNTFGLGVIADLGTILPVLRLEAFANYWGKSWDAGFYEWGWSVITVGGTAKYDFPIGKNFIPFVGGGAGLAFARWNSDWKSGTETWWGTAGVDNSDTDIDLAIHGVGGVDIPIGTNMKIIVQAKYDISGTDALWLTGGLMVQLY